MNTIYLQYIYIHTHIQTHFIGKRILREGYWGGSYDIWQNYSDETRNVLLFWQKEPVKIMYWKIKNRNNRHIALPHLENLIWNSKLAAGRPARAFDGNDDVVIPRELLRFVSRTGATWWTNTELYFKISANTSDVMQLKSDERFSRA